MLMRYKTKGTCSREIILEVDDDNIIKNVEFIGGCKGNLQGISILIKGEKAEDIAEKLEGVICRNGTSCPDQLSKALKKIINEKKN